MSGHLIRADEVLKASAEGLEALGMATPSLGAYETTVCRARFAPSHKGTSHSHDREEIIVVLAGSATADLDGELIEIRDGDTLIVPTGVLHDFHAGVEGFDCLTIEPVGIRFFGPDGVERDPPEVML